MKKLSLLFLLTIPSLWAQNPMVENISVVDSFPKMELFVNLRNPAQRPASFFQVKEGDSILSVTIVKVEKIVPEQENLLILVENLNHKDRLYFYKEVLKDALRQADLENTKVNIAVFDRVRNDGTQAVFPLLEDYTSNTSELEPAVESIEPKNDIFGNNQSADLYHAIYEGLEILNKTKGTKNLLVLSSAFNNKWSSHTSSESAKAFAQKNDISVYSLQFRIQGYEHHKLTDLAHANYGAELVSNSVQEASQFVENAIQSLPEKQGNKYWLEYTSAQPANGEPFTAALAMGDQQYEFLAKSPDRQSWIWYAALGLFFLLAVLFLIFYLRKKNKRSKAEKLELEDKIAQEKRRTQSIQQDLSLQTSELSALKRQEATKASEAEQQAFEKEQLAKMKTFGQLPYLQFISKNDNGSKTINHTIKKSLFTIGRAPENDLVLNDKSVSRHHAIIRFKEDGYYIKDQNSTAGIKMNGQRIAGEIRLRPNCVISLGNVDVSFVQ